MLATYSTPNFLNPALAAPAINGRPGYSDETSTLLRANRDLEMFAYSVSHDLKAPVRQIEGYVRILREDYEQSLDPKGAEWLRRVSECAARMDRLINALLGLSRISGAAVNRDLIDLGEMAASVFGDDPVNSENPGRATLNTDGLIEANADRQLLDVVMRNLIGNALKFSAGAVDPIVTVGMTLAEDGTPVYFVRDNGVGFPGLLADRLVQPFQRLHSDCEFPGHGIGLATVQRVVERHGGKVWCESEVGKGATFFFTLGEDPRS